MKDEADTPEIELASLAGRRLVTERDRELAIRHSGGDPKLGVAADPDALIPTRVSCHLHFSRLLEDTPLFFCLQMNPIILRDDALI